MKKNDLKTLSGCDIFSGLSEREIRDLVRELTPEERVYPKHGAIYTPERYENALAVLLRGSAEVYKQTDKGQLFLSILEAGAVFGMAALFYEENGFINTVRARENCRVLFFSRGQLEKIFEKHPVCAVNYITVLSRKIHYLNAKLLYLTSPTPSGRLLSWLIREGERQNTDEITLPVSFSELALLLSLGRTSLYRAFDELTAQGKLIREGKKVKLRKEESTEERNV